MEKNVIFSTVIRSNPKLISEETLPFIVENKTGWITANKARTGLAPEIAVRCSYTEVQPCWYIRRYHVQRLVFPKVIVRFNIVPVKISQLRFGY